MIVYSAKTKYIDILSPNGLPFQADILRGFLKLISLITATERYFMELNNPALNNAFEATSGFSRAAFANMCKTLAHDHPCKGFVKNWRKDGGHY